MTSLYIGSLEMSIINLERDYLVSVFQPKCKITKETCPKLKVFLGSVTSVYLTYKQTIKIPAGPLLRLY